MGDVGQFRVVAFGRGDVLVLGPQVPLPHGQVLAHGVEFPLSSHLERVDVASVPRQHSSLSSFQVPHPQRLIISTRIHLVLSSAKLHHPN